VSDCYQTLPYGSNPRSTVKALTTPPLLRELLDADIDMERIEQLHIQAGWSLQQVKEYFVAEGLIEPDDAPV
jgi:hypothetical protein